MRQVLLWGVPGLVCLGALRGLAQEAPKRHYYAGVGGVAGSYQLSAQHTNSVLAPQLLGGVRLSPRLALEVSLTLHHDRTDKSSSGIYQLPDAAGNFTYLPATFRSVYQQRTQAVAITARYALLRHPVAGLQLDALLGAAVVHADTYGFNATLDQQTQATVRSQYYVRYDATGGCLLLGPSLRYRLGPRVELTGEYIANFGGEHISRIGRLSGTVGLGVRYHFGS